MSSIYTMWAFSQVEGINVYLTQHQQKQNKDCESQHKEQQPHYIEQRATGRDRLVHIPGQYNQQIRRHRGRRQSKDKEGKSCINHTENNLESKTITKKLTPN